ncbi:MAG: DeoR/GlpR family DNA-binding transcription regulator [Clostridia bacterium]|nr:DeoR/GlpR family DNA-binding transcription regulator [Clostridia bacterium]
MSNERQQQILQILEQKGEVQLQQLKDFFPDVSVMTLRRDLTSLESDGYLIRTHGGAVSAKKLSAITGEEDAYSRRAAESIEAKLRISEKALPFVEPGRSIYFDAGSTIMFLSRILPDDNYSIVTSGGNIALELVKKQRVSVVTIGGLVNKNTLSMSGPHAMALLESINIDIALMSASGFSLDSGFTVSNVYECEIKRKVVQRAKKVIVLLDSSKLDKSMPFTYANLADVDLWICEKPLPEEIKAEAEKHGVQVI